MCLAALALPALGWADGGGGTSPGSGGSSGGSAGGGNSGGSGLQPGKAHAAEPADQSVSSSSNGVTLTTAQSGFLSRELLFSGTAPSAAAGEVLDIEREGPQTNGVWTSTAHATVRRDGSFSASWHVNHIGQFAFRAVLSHPQGGAAASAWPTVTVIIYRPATATQYGPGFYGKRTACGQVLHRQTLGVANRTLPCGTPVAVYYGGRMIVVPVIDRGPYTRGVDWDLTEATGRALGIAGTAKVGAVSLPRHG